MEQGKIKLTIIIGSNRKGNHSKYVGDFVTQQAKSRSDLDVTVVYVGDYVFTQNDYYLGEEESTKYKELVESSDSFVIVTPEYNHSFPGNLKMLLDQALKEYVHKPVGYVSVSSGQWGGTRVIESLLPVVRELGLVSSSNDLHFPKVQEAFNEQGEIVDENYYRWTTEFFDELLFLARSLKYGRKELQPSE